MLEGTTDALDSLSATAAAKLDRQICTLKAKVMVSQNVNLDAHVYFARWLGFGRYNRPIEALTTNYDLVIESHPLECPTPFRAQSACGRCAATHDVARLVRGSITSADRKELGMLKGIGNSGICYAAKPGKDTAVWGDSRDGTGVSGTSDHHVGVYGRADYVDRRLLQNTSLHVKPKVPPKHYYEIVGVHGETNLGGSGKLGMYGVGVEGVGNRLGVVGYSLKEIGTDGPAAERHSVLPTAGVLGVGTGCLYAVAGLNLIPGLGNGVYGSGDVGVEGFSNSGNIGVYGSAIMREAGKVSRGGRGVVGISHPARDGIAGFFSNYREWWRATLRGAIEPTKVYGLAGYFLGDVEITGQLTKAASMFRIDHPLEPRKKNLIHACIESPELKTFYDGTVTLDAKGRATVRLPKWFGKLNTSLRYQLTAIGRAAPNLHVAREVRRNAFEIAGGPPSCKVSWQVTGVRQDAWAKANPMEVEPRKKLADRGRYIHPELYGSRTPPIGDQPVPEHDEGGPVRIAQMRESAATLARTLSRMSRAKSPKGKSRSTVKKPQK